MPDISIPQARRIVVDTTGAQIVQEESPAVSTVGEWWSMRQISLHGLTTDTRFERDLPAALYRAGLAHRY